MTYSWLRWPGAFKSLSEKGDCPFEEEGQSPFSDGGVPTPGIGRHGEKQESTVMLKYLYPSWSGAVVVVAGLLLAIGGCQTPIDLSEFARGPAPLRMPSPAGETAANSCSGDALAGGRIFDAYCGYCHNSRSLAERPFSNYQNVAQHMRVRA